MRIGEREEDFLAAVIEFAQLGGFLVYHTRDSRGSHPGFPDLVLVRERVLYRELKTDRGQLSEHQRRWLVALRGAGSDAGVWRPRDWPCIADELRAQRRGDRRRQADRDPWVE